MIGELIPLLLLGMFAWYWLDSLKAREIAVAAAAAACAQEGVQFLDDTVAQDGLRLVRGADGRLRLQRSFAFEYSRSGDDRHPGYVTLLGHEVILLDIVPRTEPEERPPRLH